jgi:two-component system, NarL family, sensor kinase
LSRDLRKDEPADEVANEVANEVGGAGLVERLRGIHRENELLFQRLVDGEQRFRSLARAVWEVQEEERRRVARELHDGVGQTLTALKIRLERTAGREGVPPELAGELATGVELAARALDEARRLAHLLRPQVLDDLGLFPALRWLARTLEEWTGFRVDLRLDPEEPPEAAGRDAARLGPEVETLAFRVVQEGLTNAMKHSAAGAAQVRVERSPERLRLRVCDHGGGFDVREALEGTGTSAGFGLRGMRERVELAGGRFELRSGEEEEGTRLEAELPIHRERGERRRT